MASIGEIRELAMIAKQSRGLDFRVRWEAPSGKPIDLTTFTAAMQVKDAEGNVVFDLSMGNGVVFVDTTKGLLRLHLDTATVAAVTLGTYRYDLKMAQAGTGWKGVILRGDFIVGA